MLRETLVCIINEGSGTKVTVTSKLQYCSFEVTVTLVPLPSFIIQTNVSLNIKHQTLLSHHQTSNIAVFLRFFALILSLNPSFSLKHRYSPSPLRALASRRYSNKDIIINPSSSSSRGESCPWFTQTPAAPLGFMNKKHIHRGALKTPPLRLQSSAVVF